MGTGKLYSSSNEQFVADVDYQIQHETTSSWWGELVLVNYMRINDGAGYIIELEDKRKGRCYLKKRVNRAVTGVPPRYTYHFAGTGPLE